MKIRVIAAVLAVVALSAGSVFAKASTDPYSPQIEIINKAKLPPVRLADALFAKYILSNESKKDWMMEYAAKLNPSDPVYAYLLVPHVSLGYRTDTDQESQDWMKNRQDKARKLLDKILLNHPNYLPALYKRAVMEPSLDKQMKTLEKIAQIDKDNAVPYYTMAALKLRRLIAGNKMDDGTFTLTDDEWNSITALIAKGNSQPDVQFIYPRTPSAQDIAVTMNEKPVPTEVVDNLLVFLSEIGYNPNSFDDAEVMGNTILKQIGRQATSKATLWDSQKRSSEALAMLETYASFSKNLAASKPYRLMHLMVAEAIYRMVVTAEIDILKKRKSEARVAELQKEIGAWSAAISKCSVSLALIMQPVEDVESAPGEPLTYFTVASEEAITAKILKELGLVAK